MLLIVAFSSQLTTSSLYKLAVHRAIFCLSDVIRIRRLARDVTATCNHAHLGTRSIILSANRRIKTGGVLCRDCGDVLSVREHAEPEESESELEHRSSRLRSSMVDNQEEVVCVSPVEAFATVIKLLDWP